MKNKAKNVISIEMREKAEEGLTELRNRPYGMSRLVREINIDSKEVGRCMRGSDGKLCFSEKERGNVWKDYMERIMNAENDWDHNVEGDAFVIVCRG